MDDLSKFLIAGILFCILLFGTMTADRYFAEQTKQAAIKAGLVQTVKGEGTHREVIWTKPEAK